MEEMSQPNNTSRDANRKTKPNEVLAKEFSDFAVELSKSIQEVIERKYEREEASSREWNEFWEERQKSTRRFEQDLLESYQKLRNETKRNWEDIGEINKAILRESRGLHELHEETRRERNEHDEDRREEWRKIEALEEKLHAANLTIQMLKDKHPEDECTQNE